MVGWVFENVLENICSHFNMYKTSKMTLGRMCAQILKSLEVISKVLRHVVILEVSRGIFIIPMVFGGILENLVVLGAISIILKVLKVLC